jgi:hypothetical protein
MKQFILALSALAMVLLLGTACSPTPDDGSDEPQTVQEEEPNDDRSTADYLSVGDNGQGTAGDGSEDWWKVGTVENYSYTFTATADVSLTVEVYAWDNNANALTGVLDTLTGTSISKTITYGADPDYDDGTGQEQYYFVVSSGTATNYELTYAVE